MTKSNFLLFFYLTFFFMPALAQPMTDYPMVKLQALDKSTARTVTLKAKVGETIQYGSLFIKVQACRKSEPLEKPESTSFIQVWEVPVNSDKSEWIFSGWMFASSPALSAMDHAVYDVWVLDCISDLKDTQKKPVETKTEVKTSVGEMSEEEKEEKEGEEIEIED